MYYICWTFPLVSSESWGMATCYHWATEIIEDHLQVMFINSLNISKHVATPNRVVCLVFEWKNHAKRNWMPVFSVGKHTGFFSSCATARSTVRLNVGLRRWSVFSEITYLRCQLHCVPLQGCVVWHTKTITFKYFGVCCLVIGYASMA